GNKNYKETIYEYKLGIKSVGELIEFKNKEIEYVFGTNQGKISNQTVVNIKNNHSSLRGVTYSAKIKRSYNDIESIGIQLIGGGPDKGKIYVDNMDSLSKGIADNLEKYG